MNLNPKKKLVIFFLLLYKNSYNKSKIKTLQMLNYNNQKNLNKNNSNIIFQNSKQIKYIITVKLTYSNIIFNLTDYAGNSKIIKTTGIYFFKGKLKTSKYSATTVTEMFIKCCNEYFQQNNNSNPSIAFHITGIKKIKKIL